MLKRLALLLMTMNSMKALSCSVELPQELFFIEKPTNFKSVRRLLTTDCLENIQWPLIEFLSEGNGEISVNYLRNKFKNIHFGSQTNKITVSHLKERVRQDYLNKYQLDFLTYKENSLTKAIAVNSNEYVNITCNNCDRTGNTNIVYSLDNPINNISRKGHVLIELGKYQNVLVPTRDLQAFHQVQEIDFITKRRLVKNPLNSFIDASKLKHHKLNKPLTVADHLQKHDLTAVNLVNIGNRVKVLLKHDGLQIKTEGIARSSGKYNELINVYNEKSRKTYLAKVIDHYQVEVSP